jgi:hypothetical protein
MPRSAFKVGSLSHNHPNSQPVRVASDASPSGVTKERSQSCRCPLQAKMVQTIAQTTAPTAKRLKRTTRAPSAFPGMFHPQIRLTLATRRTSTIRRSRDEVTQRCNVGPPCRAQNRSPSKEGNMPRGKARSDKDLATANGLFCYGFHRSITLARIATLWAVSNRAMPQGPVRRPGDSHPPASRGTRQAT